MYGWWYLYACWGCAARDYAFAARSGRRTAGELDPVYLQQCENEIIANAKNWRDWSHQNAYGTSLAPSTKQFGEPGWYFSTDFAFEIAVGDELLVQLGPSDPRYSEQDHTDFISTMLENFNFQHGCNPVNVAFVTGEGYKRQREIVHQYSNFPTFDHRLLPPSGIPLGNLAYRDEGRPEIDAIFFPASGDSGSGPASFLLYDRWADVHNVRTEFVSWQTARGLATAAYLNGLVGSTYQPWTYSLATVVFPNGNPVLNSAAVAQLSSTLDLSDALIVWDVEGAENPAFGSSFTLQPRPTVGETLVEAEAVLPDGRRVFGRQYVHVNDPINGGTEFTPDQNTVALYHFDGSYTTVSPQQQSFPTSPNNFVTFNNLVIGKTYKFTLGPNCSTFTSGSTTIHSTVTPAPTGTFVADSTTAQVWGNPNSPYDGTLNLIFKDDANHYDMTVSGKTALSDNTAWMSAPRGNAARFSWIGDRLQATIPDGAIRPANVATFSIEARIYPKSYPINGSPYIMSLAQQNPNGALEGSANWSIYYNAAFPQIYGPNSTLLLNATDWNTKMTTNTWHSLKMTFDMSASTTTLFIDGQQTSPNPVYTGGSFVSGESWVVTMGDFVGDIDEVRVSITTN